MGDKHLSTQFDSELRILSGKMMELGGLVEAQVRQAVGGLTRAEAPAGEDVLAIEIRVNAMEVDIDRDIANVIARRQPIARDLRLLMGISKATANLERVGDEAVKIARILRSMPLPEPGCCVLPSPEVQQEAHLALGLLRKALDAFARLDIASAVAILEEDAAIDREFDALMRSLVTCMTQNPTVVPSGLDLLFVAKAIERVGDHAKNVAELVIYIVKGADVRHTPFDRVRSAMR
ncbi:phosphate signaling complex protein PhoU [Candidatus Symbiobacter mobilis]|uniref:Phosphate-specific transport system accessory protein PhoU n=1 Tax=Candidatus Symbiobacter mobilis CR TaxID=946483 RepID=U5N5Y6_9BURK|nr:phosphate signaling complex protein PhoU [Candidatus Symbiobacter mobilis]AGX86777.1 phosphate transporter protein PhoU [Candidatus Symbiobacter mobilis CR]